MEGFFCLGIIVLGVIVAVLISESNRKQRERLHEEYQQALASGDRSLALQAGRAYYSNLRSGKLTIYDEQAITNDLSTMR